MNQILSIGQSAQADALAQRFGVETFSLMKAAGAAVADAAQICAPAGAAFVLCGPGNNGGDGYVAAAGLRAAGRPVRVFSLGPVEALSGDAARAAALWNAPVEPLSAADLTQAGVVIDALFGAGLTRPLEGEAARLAEQSHAISAPVIAADVPSGLHGDLGRPLGRPPGQAGCFAARATVTFFRKKPAHVLEPGRTLCGDIVLADIGIPDSVLPELDVRAWENTPELWAADFPWPERGTHKHRRGRLAVVCGPALATGAARLSVAGGRRVGAGFTTLFGTEDALRIAAAHETGAVLKPAARGAATAEAIRAFGAHAAIVGPAAGADAETRVLALDLLGEGPALVLDADALTVFADAPEALFAALRADCVLTPHEGEFLRLFPDLDDDSGSKLDRARAAAARAGCTVLLKGPDTVIAAPDGRAAVTTETTPFLASAGTGDVLAGIIGGLMAQHMPAFAAACAGAWLHGRAGRLIGPGLIAEDIPDALPEILSGLRAGAA